MLSQRSLKRHLLLLPLVLSVLFALSGCHGPQYKEAEKEALEQNGEAMMQAWLDEQMKGSKVLTAEADVYMYPSGPHYLTDYVAGTMDDGGTVRDYLINTKTGAVYLIHDGELLSEVCLDYAFENLGLDEYRDACRADSPSASMWLPDSGNSYAATENSGTGIWMPGELALSLENAAGESGTDGQRETLESFVRSPESRGPIQFGCTIRVPDEVELEQYNMAYWLKQQEENGVVFENLYLSDAFENISTYSGRASYERNGFRTIEEPDISILMKEAYWVEKKGKNGIEVEEGRENNLSDLSFQKTEKGYLVTFPDYDHIFDFSIYAGEESEFRKHRYHCREDREAYLSPGSKISGDRYFEEDLYWKEAGEDGYLLTDEKGFRKLFFGGEELIPVD